ncbi:GreA/GreB family elongation factor [Polaribacter sargassicola]|uniref:GreA/GreB family elongation factor n=1 Tax=Polaribacter sargassicola TaxID=2836891 RepID=UPI001F4599C2|nr:GreA/GreB family elongation factor [Polaribacter sp. DS7-9]MCG1035772.1 GreA/GreB family elongation factor [Polaribacter sp. DS7-9]
MKYHNLIIEKKEYVFLKRLLNITEFSQDFKTQNSLNKLTKELNTAQIIDEEEMPDDVIRFNSIVKISTENGWKNTLQIVIPSEKDITKNKVSIKTPIAAALFGYSENDELICDFPVGKKKIKIIAVQQDKNSKKIEVLL